MLEFLKINGFEKGQRESFEELVCVLAKRERPSGAVEFQRVEGAGGDGGVEALWISGDGTKTGYQAKFFSNLGSSQWSQIDESVKRALEVHPELKRYVVAIPVNLTHKKWFFGFGKSAWEKWQASVAKWTNWASEKGLEVVFEPWTASDLNELLLRDENHGLVQHWFGEQVLGVGWFNNAFNTAKNLLEDRYSPSEHVNTSHEKLFDALVRGPSTMAEIRGCYHELSEKRFPSIDFKRIAQQPSKKDLQRAEQAWSDLVATETSFSSNYWDEWHTEDVDKALVAYREALSPLEAAVKRAKQADDADAKRKDISDIDKTLSEALIGIFRFRSLLRKKNLQAERARCAIVTGPAGAGKSHLLAHIADQRLSNEEPTVLLVGQSFSDAEIWGQIGAFLDIAERTSGEILGLLSAAAERQGKRALVMIDAINEGVGANYWRDRISGLLAQAKDYPDLAFVFSCREEYLKFAFPKAVLEEAAVFRVSGFDSLEEIEAAAVSYLDAKGISRPNTPWLSPEFRNPLFLKSTSEALQAKGEIEFPKGLHGISQLMAFYLDSLSLRTGVDGIDHDLLATAIKRTVKVIAAKMVESGEDFVDLETADQITAANFSQLPNPRKATWLSVLTRSSIMRRDPPPFETEGDPLNPDQDRIRFAFQRFQDHLMAQTVVDQLKADGLTKAFEQDGELSFLFFNRDVDQGFSHSFAGLLGALSTIYPERFGVEFTDTLPEGAGHWSRDHILQEAFETSCKWRRLDSFTDRSLELLNAVEEKWIDKLALLVEVSMTIDHPWNATFLHDWLIDQPMPERDSNWTNWVNWAGTEQGNQIDRLVSWSNGSAKADIRHLELAGLVLCWMLTSSRRTTRDQASKALTSIFLRQSTVFQFVLDKLANCDDPYLIERLYSSAFGACCIDQSAERLSSYSSAVWEAVFKDGEPPVALLTRDYALGIVELAEKRNALSTDVDLDACKPPFGASPPELEIAVEDLKAIAEERGSEEILRSAHDEWGDFGKYTIPGRVRSFLTATLDSPAPMSKDQVKDLFIEEVVAPFAEREAALATLQELQNRPPAWIIKYVTKGDDEPEVDEDEEEKLENEVLKARQAFEALLPDPDKDRFYLEYLREGLGHAQYDSVNVQRCRYWITKRAYELGWTKELFPNDGRGTYGSRHENDLERIGKKYQWIALDEISARLSDNFWYLNEWPETPVRYRYAHQNFYRDIEPTILPTNSRFETASGLDEDWMIEPIVRLPEVSEDNLKSWPFAEDPTNGLENKLVRYDKDGARWRILYEFNCERQRYANPSPGHGARYEEFRFIYCVFVKNGDAEEFVAELDERRSLDVSDFNPREVIDGPFLLEAFWRDTWTSEKFSEVTRGSSESYRYSNPVARYYWESKMDKTLPDGFGVYVPQRWLAEDLGIRLESNGVSGWIDDDGNELIKALKPVEDKSAVLIREEALLDYCKREGVTPISLLIAERNTWPSGNNDHSCWRRSEGAWWETAKGWKSISWNNDTKR